MGSRKLNGWPEEEDLSQGYNGTSLERLVSAFAVSQFALHCWSAVSTCDPQVFLMHGIASFTMFFYW